MAGDYVKQLATFDRHKGGNRVFATNEEKKAIIKSCGEPAVVLYEFYLSKVVDTEYQFTDRKTADVFGWQKPKAERIRRKLEAVGCFSYATVSGNGVSGKTYYIGPTQVMEHLLKIANPQEKLSNVIAALDGKSVTKSTLKPFFIKRNDNQKIALLKRWIKANLVGISSAELDAFASDDREFIEQSTDWIWRGK